ncbi:S-layer homology domain-containing protein [Candidatus Peregrinibacteria bacterium]|nr:S-layer homology domain-containing protein [Candidatus Peregrinibacteria bacterium]
MFSVRRFSFIGSLLLIALFFAPALALAYCGDGALEEARGEQCDDGNIIDRDGCSAYCEVEDMEPPVIESISIPNEATDISTITSAVTVVFSEPLDPGTVNLFNIRLEHIAESMDISLDLRDDHKTLIININEELFSEDRHAIRIKYIKDVPGNQMAEEFISVFDTAVAIDRTPPNVVVTPPGGTYHFAQSVELKPYIGSYTNSDEFLDETAIIYYTLNDLNITEKSNIYKTPISIREGTTLRYFSVDGKGNQTPVYTERYSLTCPEFENAKEVVDKYPECKVLECNQGFILKGNVCVVRMGGEDPDDYKTNAVTAPLLSSSTPMTITSKPAIYLSKEHHGMINRPIIFKDPIRGTVIQFERDTKITWLDGKPFYGYIKHPTNLYTKDFPINFGYTFRSIFEFTDAEGNDLHFFPPYRITIPYTDAFDPEDGATVLTYNPETETYTEYDKNLYSVDLIKKTVTVTADNTDIFFIAQTGKNFNKAVFTDTVDHWSRNYVEALYRLGIVKGKSKGIYAPDEYLTRAEFAKIVLKAIGAETENPEAIEDKPFRDVHLYAWYLPYVKKAKQLGLISGYSGGLFKPEQFINRAEAIKMILTAFEFDLNHRPVSESVANQRRYTDLKTGQWYFPYVDFAIQNGIMQGFQKNRNLYSFGPDKFITRGEMAKLAVKTIELKEEWDKK